MPCNCQNLKPQLDRIERMLVRLVGDPDAGEPTETAEIIQMLKSSDPQAALDDWQKQKRAAVK